MTVRVYRSDDASAPVLSGQAGALIGILDACLVNGYGAKAAAGWTKPYSGTNLAAYRQGTGSNQLYLRVDDTTTTNARMVAYESMSDVNTGTNAFPSESQQSGGLYVLKSTTANSTARPWIVIATEKAFYFWPNFNQTSMFASDGTMKPMIFFGDITTRQSGDAYHTMISAGTSNSWSSFSLGMGNSSIAANMAGQFLARSYTQTGASSVSGKVFMHSMTNTVNIGYTNTGYTTAYPDPVAGGMLLAPIWITEGASGAIAVRGTLPGMWAPLHSLPAQNGDTFTGSGDMAGKTFIILDLAGQSSWCRAAFETSDTW